jgi:hypothetical protein
MRLRVANPAETVSHSNVPGIFLHLSQATVAVSSGLPNIGVRRNFGWPFQGAPLPPLNIHRLWCCEKSSLTLLGFERRIYESDSQIPGPPLVVLGFAPSDSCRL